MTLRIATTAALAILIGTWAYLAEWSYEQADSLHAAMESLPVVLTLFALTFLGGLLVGRVWVLPALLGPIASLGYLESTGHIGPDGISPLASPPGIAQIIWFGVLLALGVAASSLWRKAEDRQDPMRS
jgi:hypothetical protein